MTNREFKKRILGMKSKPRRQSMKKRSIGLGVIGLLLMAALLGALNQSGEDLFQKALRLERNEGKLMEAIELYNKVVAEKGNEGLAAKAQLRIGICYERLGQKNSKQAQDAFQKVIDNYPSQPEEVRMAREKLATLARVKVIAQKGKQNLSIQKAWSGQGVDLFGEISPDGKYLCFTDWDTGDLAIREMATGKNRRITDKGSWLKSSAFAIFSQWSPDGRFLAYGWFNPEGGRFELRLSGLENPRPRILFENKDKEYKSVYALDWHPDGKQILTAFFKGSDTLEIGFLSVADKKVRMVKTFKGNMANTNAPMNFRISPDGRTIAYDYHSGQNPKNRDIFLLSADGTHEQRLIEHPAFDFVCDWTADGRHFLFGSDRTGDPGLWIAQVKEGRVLENPNLIKADMGMFSPLGFTQQNQLYVGYWKEGYDIYQAEIDPATGQFLAPPVKQVRLYEGCNAVPEYSPDGKYFTYLSSRGGYPGDNYSLCIYSLEKDEIRELDTGLGTLTLFSYPQWRPDGRAISLVGGDRPARWGIHLIEVESEKSSPLVLVGKNEKIYSHRWAIDGHTLFYTKGDYRKTVLIYSHDLKTGQDKVLPGSPDDAIDIDVSPDGKWLAFLNRGRKRNLRIIPTAGGVPQELYSFKTSPGGSTIRPAWSADGKYIFLCSKTNSANDERDMWRFSLEDRQAQKINLNTVSFKYLSVHPDGRHIIFSTQANSTANNEVWVMENFLPRKKARK
jgi:Tol biopolymer transport system component